MDMISIFYSAAENVNSYSCFIELNVLTLKVTMLTMHRSKFGLGSVTDFSNTGLRTPTSIERTLIYPQSMQLGRVVWISHSNFSVAVFLLNKYHYYRWVAVFSWQLFVLYTHLPYHNDSIIVKTDARRKIDAWRITQEWRTHQDLRCRKEDPRRLL